MTLLEERMANPVHWGEEPGSHGVGAIGNPACGDVIRLFLYLEEESIVKARFTSSGSAYQLATASILCDCVTGQTISEARARSPACVLEKLPDLPENKQYLARLAIDGLARALDDCERRLDPKAPASIIETLSEEDARNALLGLLAHERKWGTQELVALLEAENQGLPRSALRILSDMRKEGLIEGEMGADSYRWWIQ